MCLNKEYNIKTCINCHKQQPLENFYFRKSYNLYYNTCIKCSKAASAKRQLDKKELINKQRRDKYKNNTAYREKIKLISISDRKNPKYKKRMREYHKKYKQWYSKTTNRKIRSCIGTRIRLALKGKRKSQKTIQLLGCNISEFVKYIENLWKEKMSWNNYGFGHDRWVLDHIIPCAAFDLSSPTEQEKCFHYSNIQPLWWIDNQIKSDLLPSGQRARKLI